MRKGCDMSEQRCKTRQIEPPICPECGSMDMELTETFMGDDGEYRCNLCGEYSVHKVGHDTGAGG